jgi:hypothetical protein
LAILPRERNRRKQSVWMIEFATLQSQKHRGERFLKNTSRFNNSLEKCERKKKTTLTIRMSQFRTKAAVE